MCLTSGDEITGAYEIKFNGDNDLVIITNNLNKRDYLSNLRTREGFYTAAKSLGIDDATGIAADLYSQGF